MRPSDVPERTVVVAIGLLVILAPVLIVAVTVFLLGVMGDLVLGALTPIEFLELYVVELLLFVGFAYGLYQLTRRLIVQELPDAMDALEETDGETKSREEPSHEELRDDG